jgi:hypothetical protein
MKIKALIGAGIVTGSMFIGSAAGAAVTFNEVTGVGFAGKGDVQTALALNNNQLQKLAGMFVFTYQGTSVQETSWTCINERNENVQERERTITTETSGLVSHLERDKTKQITGFILGGFNGTVSTVTSTDGPKLESCPNANSTYVLGSTVVGDAEVTGGGLFVNGKPLPITPAA